jgi:outer membrane protein assembly complex protein YaeT
MRRAGRPEGRLYVLLLILLCAARRVDAAVTDYIGKSIVEVRVQVKGAPIQSAELIDVIETRTGTPLAMVEVRESMGHLFGLGLYRDVQVDAAPLRDGVVLTYNLFPAQRVRRILFDGSLGLSETDLRRTIVERHGASPSLARASQAVATLQAVYRDHGYPKASIAVRAGNEADPSNTSMVFTIQPGARARIAAIDVQGTPLRPVPQLLSTLDLRVGDAYDGVELDTRLLRLANELRAEGYYEARVAQFPRWVDGDAAVNLVVSIDPGPRVEIIFQGDPLAAGDRDRLVPIAREHSVDEDLLEDSKFGIERHFREHGFCNPRADYQRAESEGVLRVTFTVAHGPQCMVEDAVVTGNSSMTSAELAPLVVTKAGQPFNDSTVGSDAMRLQGYYRQRGFTAVKVTSQVERREPKAGIEFVRVRLVIAEGVRSVIGSVTFIGNAAISAETLRGAVRTAAGQPYFEPQIAADADTIALLYLNRGYPEVTVQPTPRAIGDGSKVELDFAIHEGPQILIDHVLIVGHERTSRDTILREVRLKSGQPLSQQEEDETRAGITSLGLFRRVDISYLQLPGEQNRRDVVITVEEAPVTTISYGGGLEGGKRLVRSSDAADAVAIEEFQVAPRGFFQIGRRNLFGKDRSLDLFTRVSFRPKGISAAPNAAAADVTDEGGYGFNEYLARLTYGERRILGTDADLTISGGVEQAVRSSFDFNRRGANATMTRRVSRTLAISGRYGIDKTELLNIKSNFAAQPEIDRLFPQVRLSSVASSLIRDTRLPDSIEPNSGSLIGVDAELAARSIGSQVGFFKTFVQGFTYQRLPRSSSTVFAFGARVGLATGFPRTVMRDGETIVVEELPASERFFAGGDTTVRGFTLDRLGTSETIDPDDFPTGGHGLIVLNVEARIPLRGGLGAVAFVDGGNVWPTVTKIDLSQMRGAVGFGLRYRSPVGPIRIDLGFKLDRRPLRKTGELERPTALHISLGQAF